MKMSVGGPFVNGDYRSNNSFQIISILDIMRPSSLDEFKEVYCEFLHFDYHIDSNSRKLYRNLCRPTCTAL